MRSILKRAGLLAFLPPLVGCVSAQHFTWGTSVSLAPLGYFSSGTATGTDLTWTLGYFTGGFVPTDSNFADWSVHYVEVDRAFEIFENPIYSVSGTQSNAGTEAAGRQAWIFAYNDLCAIGTSSGEALLFAQTGLLFTQDSLSGSFDIEDNPNSTDDDSFNVVWGRLDRDRDAAGGLITGGGIFSSPLGDSTSNGWEAQAATWPAVPGDSPFLIAVAAINNPDLRGEDDDPDGDGRGNLHEHAAGTDLNTTDPGYPMLGPANPGTVSITLPAARPSDVCYTVEYSTTLSGGWDALARCVGSGPWQLASPLSTTPAPGSREIIEFASPTGGRGFFRLNLKRISP